MPKVWHMKDPDLPDNHAIYVGRPSIYGNPFKMPDDGTREEVIKRFREEALPNIPEEQIDFLKGKDLVCWCAPEACHADVLLEVANGKD